MPVELLTAVFGAVSSFLSGLLGIGGGIVLTPLLLYVPPLVGATVLPIKIITGLTIVQAISGSTLGMLRHRSYGNVSGRLVRLMGPTGGMASLVGALVSGAAPDRLLIAIFAAFALINVPLLLRPERDPDRTVDEVHVNEKLAVAIAVVIGFFGGMVGIGAIGFLLAAMVYLLRVPVRIAIGSSLGAGMFAAVAALIGKAATSQIDPPLAAIVVGAALVASPIGAAVSQRTKPRVLMLLLAGVVAIAGLRMAWQAIVEMA
ncbi:MAG: sulfite exporter TauE/SafE family protein [Candidatus Limnocylindria bacterium]